MTSDMREATTEPAGKSLTIDGKMKVAGYRPSGFDYLRLALALGVIWRHSLWMGTGKEAALQADLLDPFGKLIVPLFFALSGFLVAGSLARSKTLVSFFALRVVRIVPALSVEVTLSALILGPIFTAYELDQYFTDPQFFVYFLNIIGEIHYHLPGVFLSNPNDTVNAQLWTIPFELICYALLGICALFSIFHKRAWLLAFVLALYAGQIVNSILRPQAEIGTPTGSTVVMAFFGGLLLFKYKDALRHSLLLCILATIFCYVAVSLPNGHRFIAVPAAYIAVYLGATNPKRNAIALSGDYSYGMYLYGFPIQQALIASSTIFTVWYWNLLVAVPLTVGVACFSWWVVEKPVLDRKHLIKKLEAWYLNNSLGKRYRTFLAKILPVQMAATD